MTDDEDGEDEELETLWNPAQSNTSARPKKALELVVADGKEAYSAFEPSNTPYRCVVHSYSTNDNTIFSYHQLGDVDFSSMHDFVMFTTHRKCIRIYGHDLQLLVTALSLHSCKVIREYSKDKHLTPPANDGAPFIDRIEITDFAAERNPRPSKPERVAKTEKMAEEA